MAANSALIEDLLRQYTENPRRVFARLANELRKSGDYDRAIEICRGQIPHQPGYISGHIVLGQSLYDSGRLDDARQSFETALNLDPENLIALRHLGDIARQHGENDVARGWYRRLLDVDPQNEEVIAQLEAMGEAGGSPPPPEPVVAEALAPAIDLDITRFGDASVDTPKVEGLEVEIDEYRVENVPNATTDNVAEREPLEIETAEAFEPTGGAEKAFPDLEQSLEVSGIGGGETPAAEAQSMFGDSVLDETRQPSSEEPRDAVDAYYPMLDVQSTSPSPTAFVTETMAELYLQQGYVQEALDIYRQLAAQTPADETLRERVRQLEQGSRSSIGIAAVSDEIVEAAHKRATAKPKRTIRHFFAKLVMRRVVDRPASDDAGGERGGTESDDETPDAGRDISMSAAPSLSSMAETPRRAAPELEEPAWLRDDSPSDETSRTESDEPFALLDATDLSSASSGSEGAGARARANESPDDIPWLSGYAPGPNETASADEASLQPAPDVVPPSELFPSKEVKSEDENAAATLASVFEPEFASRLTPVRPVSAQPSGERGGTPASGSPATRRAEDDLSLDRVFGRTPSGGTTSSAAGYSFDDFFEQGDNAATGENKDGSSEIELFNTWLDQLKK